MKEFEKAIYYQANIPSQYENPILVMEYSNAGELRRIISSLKNNIEVISIFYPKDHVAYSLLEHLYYNYDSLFLDKISCLFLVNRTDFCIQLVKKDADVETIAILKIDSILSEKYNKNSWSSYLVYPSLILIGAVSGTFLFEYFRKDLSF